MVPRFFVARAWVKVESRKVVKVVRPAKVVKVAKSLRIRKVAKSLNLLFPRFFFVFLVFFI